MIDYSKIANSGHLRHITFNGKDSLADFGVFITRNSTKINNISPRIPTIKLPYRNGVIIPATDEVFYDERKLTYEFKVICDTAIELQNKISSLNTWLMSRKDNEIYDSSSKSYYFRDCVCLSTNEKEKNVVGAYVSYLTANFIAYPLQRNSRLEERL